MRLGSVTLEIGEIGEHTFVSDGFPLGSDFSQYNSYFHNDVLEYNANVCAIFPNTVVHR